MGNFNFLRNRIKPTDLEPVDLGAVRTRATGIDAFAGLRGHAYAKARGLGLAVKPVQTPALLRKTEK